MPSHLLPLLYALPIGLSALLMFWLQPMVTKLLLPALGGAPAVWNVAMVLFQALLLCGYLYAHLLSKCAVRVQALVHGALWVVSLTYLWWVSPVMLADGVGDTTAWMSPQLWLLTLLATAIGPLFFLLSSTSPLMQHWFSRLPHERSENPYVLYAVSNYGSVTGLLGFLLVIEPWWGLSAQQEGWRWGYVLLACVIVIAAVPLWRKVGNSISPATHHSSPISSPATMLRWLLLAFVPSGLLLGVTHHITTEIAPMPLLWVVPLALYLLSFSLTFVEQLRISQAHLLKAQMVLVVPLIFAFYSGITKGGGLLILLWHCLAFFVSALVCHRMLYLARPPAQQLTGFYLVVSLGGVLGGAFTVFLAPVLFEHFLEYPLLLAAALMLRPGEGMHPLRALLWAVGMLAILAVTPYLMAQAEGLSIMRVGIILMLNVFALKFLFDQEERPLRLGLCYAAVVLAGLVVAGSNQSRLFQGRNFFGTLTVVDGGDGVHRITHGSTVHGAQYQDADNKFTPLTYFHPSGPLGEIFADVKARAGMRAIEVGIIGLGAGSMACYGSEDDRFIFYEINPMVQHVAENMAWFSFLSDCPPESRTILGDARIMLQQSEARYDLFILDAFNSDAIPVHLVTEEAFSLYAAHVREGGMIAAHISNRYVDLTRVLAGIAAEAGLQGAVRFDEEVSQEANKKASLWVVLARQGDLPEHFAAADSGWQALEDIEEPIAWTDDYSNLVRVLKVQ